MQMTALLIKQLAEFCKTRSEHKIVADLCAAYVIPKRSKVEETVYQVEEFGFVYLIKSGRYFKIGKTNSAGRREYELAIAASRAPNGTSSNAA